MGVFAELDRKMVAKRLRDGRLAKAAAGRKAVGDYPFGYAAIGKGRERDAEPTKAEQRAVARIVELRRAGRSYREIAKALDTEGRKPRRAASWSAAAVRNVVLRECSHPRQAQGGSSTAGHRTGVSYSERRALPGS